jgi:hypothetical protein
MKLFKIIVVVISLMILAYLPYAYTSATKVIEGIKEFPKKSFYKDELLKIKDDEALVLFRDIVQGINKISESEILEGMSTKKLADAGKLINSFSPIDLNDVQESLSDYRNKIEVDPGTEIRVFSRRLMFLIRQFKSQNKSYNLKPIIKLFMATSRIPFYRQSSIVGYQNLLGARNCLFKAMHILYLDDLLLKIDIETFRALYSEYGYDEFDYESVIETEAELGQNNISWVESKSFIGFLMLSMRYGSPNNQFKKLYSRHEEIADGTLDLIKYFEKCHPLVNVMIPNFRMLKNKQLKSIAYHQILEHEMDFVLGNRMTPKAPVKKEEQDGKTIFFIPKGSKEYDNSSDIRFRIYNSI